jgi:type II secretory pathway component PulM
MAFEAVRDRWESMAPREKRLLGLLGVALVLAVFIIIGWQIQGGLAELETKNAATRNALLLITEHQDEIYAKRNSTDNPESRIPENAQPLATYLDGIATQAGVTIPEQSERPVVKKGKYDELSIDIKLRGVSLEQLSKFLRLVETSGQAVVTERLYIKPYISAHEKLDAELTIAAFEKAKTPAKGKPKPAGGAAGTDGEKSGG